MLFRRWRRPSLDEAVPPCRDYWATVVVAFPEPVPVDDAAEGEAAHVVGYTRLLGVRSRPLELETIIESVIVDGSVVWSETEWYAIRLSDLDRAIRRRIVPIATVGVWYQSGRILFPTWEE